MREDDCSMCDRFYTEPGMCKHSEWSYDNSCKGFVPRPCAPPEQWLLEHGYERFGDDQEWRRESSADEDALRWPVVTRSWDRPSYDARAEFWLAWDSHSHNCKRGNHPREAIRALLNWEAELAEARSNEHLEKARALNEQVEEMREW